MAKIAAITSIINTALGAEVFNTSRFQGGKFYELADLVTESLKDTIITRPCTVDNDGECTPIGIDDTYPFQVYHRIISLQNNPTTTDNYGDGSTWYKQTAQMVLVLVTDRGKIQMEAEDLVSLIVVNIPATIPQATLTSLGLYSADIYASGEAIIDNEIVYNREFKNVEYLLKPNSVMYSIAYTIEVVFSKNCLLHCVELN